MGNHVVELEEAVRLSRERLAAGHGAGDADGDALASYLHRRWYLGLDPSLPAPSTGADPWQSWSADWTPALGQDGATLVRLRLSAPPTTALHVLAMVTERARGWEHPWRLTSSALRATHPHPESTVVDLPAGSLLALRREVADLVTDLGRLLDRRVPALTLTIGRGASLAQQPGDGTSFGEHRCDLVARTVLATMGCHPREQVSRTLAAFAEAGVDPQRPWLSAATTRDAAWDRPWRAA